MQQRHPRRVPIWRDPRCRRQRRRTPRHELMDQVREEAADEAYAILHGLSPQLVSLSDSVDELSERSIANSKAIGCDSVTLQHVVRALAVLWAEVDPAYLDPPLVAEEDGAPVGAAGVLSGGAADHWFYLVTNLDKDLNLRIGFHGCGAPDLDVSENYHPPLHRKPERESGRAKAGGEDE